jgi:hypothetical protein
MRIQIITQIEFNDADLLALVEKGAMQAGEVNEKVISSSVAQTIQTLCGQLPAVTRTGSCVVPNMLVETSRIVAPNGAAFVKP